MRTPVMQAVYDKARQAVYDRGGPDAVAKWELSNAAPVELEESVEFDYLEKVRKGMTTAELNKYNTDTNRHLQSSLEEFNNSLKEEQLFLRKVKPPIQLMNEGMTFNFWRRAINAAAWTYRTEHTLDVENVSEFGNLDPTMLQRLYRTPEFAKALELRGVTAVWLGLSERQLMVLTLVTDLSDRRGLNTKLRQASVPGWEWEQWLSDPKFAKVVRSQSEDLLVSHNPLINMALVQRAEGGDLPSIKYVNELTGRWDPDAKQAINVREMLMGVIDILNNSIKDPELLREIGGKLAALSGGTGMMTEQEIGGDQQFDTQVIDELDNLNM